MPHAELGREIERLFDENRLTVFTDEPLRGRADEADVADPEREPRAVLGRPREIAQDARRVDGVLERERGCKYFRFAPASYRRMARLSIFDGNLRRQFRLQPGAARYFVIVPQAMRAPALPAGSLFRSSAFS